MKQFELKAYRVEVNRDRASEFTCRQCQFPSATQGAYGIRSVTACSSRYVLGWMLAEAGKVSTWPK